MSNLKQQNQERWNKCKVLASRGPVFAAVAQRLYSPEARKRYQAVEKITGVPWWFIAVVHEREASQRWDRSIAQGDPWNKKSVRVPAGRGPFKSWEEAAVDALTNCAPYAARNKDWTPGGALAMLEQYNGLGYASKGLPSPYIWAGTDQYTKGKYVADHVYDPNAVDQQLGCAGLLKFMGVFSKSVTKTTVGGLTGLLMALGASTVAFWDYIKEHYLLFGVGSVALIWLALCLISYSNKQKVETHVEQTQTNGTVH